MAVDSRRTVVILDANPQERIARALWGMGWNVQAYRELGAFRRSLLSQPDYALVDGSGESWSALECLELAKALSPRTAVVVWSVCVSIDMAQRVLAAGATTFLTKPVSAHQLAVAFGHSESLEKGQALSLEDVKMSYIEEVMAMSGSVSGAARTLGLDRRSLRRMLRRYAESAQAGSAIAEWQERQKEPEESPSWSRINDRMESVGRRAG